MKEIDLGKSKAYSSEFTSRFSIYARPAKAADIKSIIDAKATMTMGARFWPLAVEQHDNVLYVYADNAKITPGLLDTMLENGLWLADYMDQQVEID